MSADTIMWVIGSSNEFERGFAIELKVEALNIN